LKVTAFPLYKLKDIPEALRTVANKIEYDGLSATRCVLIIEGEDALSYRAFGQEPFSVAHAVGLCTIMARRIADGDSDE